MSRLVKFANYDPWVRELEESGFELAGHLILELAGNRSFHTAFVDSRRRLEAILTNGGPFGDKLRLEIGAHHPDGTATSVANLLELAFPDFESRTVDCETLIDGRPPRYERLGCYMDIASQRESRHHLRASVTPAEAANGRFPQRLL
jgi:hypothetical protein